MAIEFRCTQCSKLLRIGDEAAGGQAKCPECGAILPVPPKPAASQSVQTGSPPGAADQAPAAADGANPFQPSGQYGHAVRQPSGAGMYGDVPNYLVYAILCTVFCCLPLGIVAIVFAAQVNGKLAAGDYQGAVSYSDSARTWCWVAFWLGVIPIVIWFLIVMLMGVGALV